MATDDIMKMDGFEAYYGQNGEPGLRLSPDRSNTESIEWLKKWAESWSRKARRDRDRFRSLLKRLEWVEDTDYCVVCTEPSHCQICDAHQINGHARDCELAKALGQEGPRP